MWRFLTGVKPPPQKKAIQMHGTRKKREDKNGCFFE